MADPKVKIKRSAVEGKIPTPDQLPLGEIALNTYDKKLFASANVGLGTTVFAVNPWTVGVGTDTYNTYFTAGNVGIGSTIPTSALTVVGDTLISGVATASGGFNLGISSAGTVITSGPVKTLNFIGAGNTFLVDGTTVDISISGGGGATISDTPPVSASDGDLWWESDTGVLKIYYDDGTSQQWVDASGINQAGIFSRVATPFTATGGQTTFNVTYTVGYLDVYLNGVLLSENDYTATDGTSVVLNDAATEGDILILIAFGSTGSSYWNKNSNEDLYTLTNVGIGTSVPRFNLEVGSIGAASTSLWVNGDARITGILTVGTASITFDGNNNNIIVGTGVTIYGDTGAVEASTVSVAGSISGNLANTLTLNTSGTGLSGSTTFNNSGAATFTVTSDATSANTASTIVARDGSGNFSASALTVTTVTATTWMQAPIFYDYNNTGYYVDPAATTQLYTVLVANYVQVSSDVRLKANIETIPNALDKVLKLRGVEYDRIDLDPDDPTTNIHQYGFIAQEVEEIVPELVGTATDYKTVNYDSMTPILVEAVKEQQKMIEDMRKEIDELKLILANK